MAARRVSFSEPPPTAATESLFSRIIVGPVLFLSFLLSLFWIDRKTFSGVFGQHAQSKDTFYHSHQRKLAKHEMDEAFLMKNRVILGLVVLSSVGLVLSWWVLSQGYWYLTSSRLD